MREKAFIFTMDAVLALIPVFILLAAVSQISGVESLMLHGFILGSERTTQDTLESMRDRGYFKDLNETKLAERLDGLLPDYLSYTFEIEYNDTVLLDTGSGNISNARDVVVANRIILINVESIESSAVSVAHGGSAVTNPCCEGAGGGGGWGPPKTYNMSFFVDDIDAWDYWLVGETNDDTGVNAKYYITQTAPDPFCCGISSSDFSQNIWTSGELTEKIQIDDDLVEGTTNYVFIKNSGKPTAWSDYYVIRVPSNMSSSEISSENATRKDFAWAVLKVWRE